MEQQPIATVAAAAQPLSPQLSDRPEGVQETPRKVKLSLKILQEQILELENETHMLLKRLEQLEQRLPPLPSSQDEAAASLESPAPEWTTVMPSGAAIPAPAERTGASGNEYALTIVPQAMLLPRSARHPAPKRTFWRRLLPLRSRP